MAKKISINEASREELADLPGIGPATADTLIKLREERGGFKRVEELEEVPGIGAQTLQNLRSQVTVSSNGGSGGRKAPESASKTAQAGAQAAASNGEAAANKVVEMTRAEAEAVGDAVGTQAAAMRRTVETGAAKAEQTAHEVVEAQRDVLQAARETQQAWLGLVQEQMAANMQAVGRLSQCRTPQELAEVQADYLRGSVERWFHGSARMAAPGGHLFAGAWWSPGAWQSILPRW